MFDTYAYSQRLKGVGFTEPQVEAMTKGLGEIAMARVATREDVQDVGKELRAEIRDSENRTVICLGGAVAAMLGLTIAILKLT